MDGKNMRLLVHRKGATRAFPPHHPLIPVDYQFTGQPVLIGGTMGTCSYVLTGAGPVAPRLRSTLCASDSCSCNAWSWLRRLRGQFAQLNRPPVAGHDSGPFGNFRVAS